MNPRHSVPQTDALPAELLPPPIDNKQFTLLFRCAKEGQLGQSRQLCLRPSSNQSISQAVQTFRSGANLDDTSVFRKLVEQGVERCKAARLIEFLPMVYCRLILVKSGVRFPETYRRISSDGTLSPSLQLASEPLWNAAIAFASAELESGKKGRDLLLIARRSAEFDAVNKLLNTGALAENIRLDASTFSWPESGPD